MLCCRVSDLHHQKRRHDDRSLVAIRRKRTLEWSWPRSSGKESSSGEETAVPGDVRPEETTKKPHGLKGKRKSAIHRLRMSQAHTGKKHSQETREKIRQSVLQYQSAKVLEPKEKLFPDVQPSLDRGSRKNRVLDSLILEKAIMELSQLRREIAVWLETWYAQHPHKPSLDDLARISPEVHNKFLRYIALQAFIRSNS